MSMRTTRLMGAGVRRPLSAIAFAWLTLVSALASAQAWEEPPVVPAAQVLPPELLSSPHHNPVSLSETPATMLRVAQSYCIRVNVWVPPKSACLPLRVMRKQSCVDG